MIHTNGINSKSTITNQIAKLKLRQNYLRKQWLEADIKLNALKKKRENYPNNIREV